jgi:predicted PhzF superfamily epimerase YddE/YHI9
MKLPVFQIDAFTGEVFAGNPAVVCCLDEWPDDAILTAIAAEHNISTTGVPEGSRRSHRHPLLRADR